MKISNEFKIGVMAIIVVATSVWGYKFLRGKNLLKPTNNYYVRYDNIDALAATSPVLIRGMNVGTVAKVELEEDMTTIVATLNIKRGLRIPKDAEAVIISTGLMGGKAIDLQIKGACSGDQCAEPGSFIHGSVKGFLDDILNPDEGGAMSKVKEGLGSMLKTLGDSLTSPKADNEIAKTFGQLSILLKNLASITGVLDKSMTTYDKHLEASLANLSNFTGALSDNQEKIANAIAHLENITKEFDEAELGSNAGELITDAQATMKGLDSTVMAANATFEDLSQVMEELKDGKGSLGKLLHDEALYNNLTSTSKNLDLLLQDLRLNPKRYVNVSVFGKKQKEYEVAEDDPAYPKE